MSTKESSTQVMSTRYTRRRGKKLPKHLDIHCVDAAGIDLGSTGHYVSVPEDRDPEPIRQFGCFTAQLNEMADWLIQCGITSVAMEATGVYWMPVFRVLESRGLQVMLVNPRHVKYVPGRKTDVADCQWLRQLHTYGLLQGAFVPPQEAAIMRNLWRQRQSLVQACSREISHMQKALTQMNLHLHVVLTDISGTSGMNILRAIVNGERDPITLAQLAHPQVKSSKEEIAQALTGHYSDDLVFILKQAIDTYDFYQHQLAECDQQLATHLKRFETKTQPTGLPPRRKRRKNQPTFDLRAELYRVTGVDLAQIDGIDANIASSILCEIGFDVSAFPSEAQFVSWLGLCPNNTITGGRVKRTKTKQTANRCAAALRLAAQALWKSKSYLGGVYRRFRARLGPPQAITATAHRLARIVYRMLKYGKDYVDNGEQQLQKEHRERDLKALVKRVKQFGFLLVDPATGECVACAKSITYEAVS